MSGLLVTGVSALAAVFRLVGFVFFAGALRAGVCDGTPARGGAEGVAGFPPGTFFTAGFASRMRSFVQ